MKRGQCFGTIAAYILAAVCYLLSQSLLQTDGFTAIAIYRADQAATFDSFQNMERGADMLAITAWADAGEGQLQGEFSQATAQLYRFSGDVSPILPGQLISGNAYAEAKSAFIDENTAFQLFGTTDAAGNELVLNGKRLTVQGVFQLNKASRFLEGMEQGVALVPPDEKAALQNVGLRLTESTRHTAERVENALRALGQPSVIRDSEQERWFVTLIGKLPLLLMGLTLTVALGRAVRRALSQTRYAPRLFMMTGYWVLSLILIFRLYGPSGIPVSWVPTKWSDFSQWATLMRNLLVGFLKRQPPILPTETLAQLLRAGMLLCCVLSLMLWPTAGKLHLGAAGVCFVLTGCMTLAMAGTLHLSAAAAWTAWLTTAGFMALAALASWLQSHEAPQTASEEYGK